jgi:2-polyprenyl-3-methyl-5-hydroxy-6-metoxy-1,4-benzoquinol methylase
MDTYKETFETWNKVALLYQDKFMNLDLYNETYDYICSTITTPQAALLEIGCGPGNITRYLLTKRPDFRIHGIDIAPNMIGLAKNNNPSADFTVMDCRRIAELKTTFDGIIAGFCLPYLSAAEGEKLVADADLLLNENGFIYISFVEGNPDDSGFKTSSTGDRAYFNYYNLDRLKALLSNKGFNSFKIFKVVYEKPGVTEEIHTILISGKQKR